MVMMPGVTRPVDLPNRPTKRLNLPFIGILLPLEQFEHFQNLFHFLQGSSQRLDNRANFFDRFFHGDGSCPLTWLARRRRRSMLWQWLGRFRTFSGCFGSLVGFGCEFENSFRFLLRRDGRTPRSFRSIPRWLVWDGLLVRARDDLGSADGHVGLRAWTQPAAELSLVSVLLREPLCPNCLD